MRMPGSTERALDEPGGVVSWQLTRLRELLGEIPIVGTVCPANAASSDRGDPVLLRPPPHFRCWIGRQFGSESRFLDEGLDPGDSSTDERVDRIIGRRLLASRCAPEAAGDHRGPRPKRRQDVSRSIPRATVGGQPIVAGDTRRPPYWRWNRFWKQLYLSSDHISRETCAPLHSPPFGIGRPLAHGLWLGHRGARRELRGRGPSAAAAGRRRGQRRHPPARDAPVHRLPVPLSRQLWTGRGGRHGDGVWAPRLHLVPEVGIVEILGVTRRACSPGKSARSWRPVFSMTECRSSGYRTGDVAAYTADQRCDCGLNHPIIEALEGRVDDYLVTDDGRRIGRLSTALKRSPSIHSAQIVQDRPGHAYLLVRPGEGYRSADAAPVRDDIIERIGSFDLEIREVAEVPKAPSGKTRLVVRRTTGRISRASTRQFSDARRRMQRRAQLVSAEPRVAKNAGPLAGVRVVVRLRGTRPSTRACTGARRRASGLLARRSPRSGN